MPETTIESIEEINRLNEYIDDPDLTEALRILLRLISKPDVPHQAVTPLLVKLQAISGKLRLMAAVETHLVKSDRARKNLLYTICDVIDNTVQSLKYLAK
jgi:hypothetical protein